MEGADCSKSKPASTGETRITSGQVVIQGRPLKYVTNNAGGKMVLVQDVRDVFFVPEYWLRKRLSELRIPCPCTTRDQAASLRLAGLIAGNSSRFSIFSAEKLENILDDAQAPVTGTAHISTTGTTTKASSSDDANTTLKIKRMQAMLKSDLVGRDVNCTQAPVHPVSEAKLATPSRSPEAEDVTTRTRVVKRPQRLCDYDQQSSASESNEVELDHDWPATKRKRLDFGGSLSVGLGTSTPTGDLASTSSLSLGSLSSQHVSPSSGLVLKFQRQYSPEHEAMQWSTCSHRQQASSLHFGGPPRDHSRTSLTDRAVGKLAEEKPSPLHGQNSSAEKPGNIKQARGKVRGGSAKKMSKSSSGLPSRLQSQLSGGVGGPSAFSLSAAIPVLQPRLAVRGNQLVEAVSYSSFMGQGRVPPPDHPVWSWKVGAAVHREQYALHFASA